MKKHDAIFLIIVALLFGSVMGGLIGNLFGFNRGQKDALLGKQKYKMKVLYEYKEVTKEVYYHPQIDTSQYVYFWGYLSTHKYDSTYYDFVPVDTLIVKK